MLHYAPLLSIDSHHSQLPKRHFEQRQNAPLCVLDFKFTHVSICNLQTLISTLSLEQDMAEMHTISDFKIQITNTHTQTPIIVYVHLNFDSINDIKQVW